MPDPQRFRLGPALYDLLIETFAVVLGVSLALLANAWQTERGERAQARAARASIVEELQANRAEIAQSRDYHARLQDSLGVRMAPGQPAPGLRVFEEGFIRPAELLTTAWDAATATGALGHMDYAEVLAFSRLYAKQRRYEESTGLGGRVIYDALFERGAGGIAANFRNLLSLIMASHYLEEELLLEYDRVLAAEADSAGSR
jgi:hypothetical protein